MKLIVWSLKGGVGKTTLSLNLALHYRCGIITNEVYTMIDKILPTGKFLRLSKHQELPNMNNINKNASVVFDMGGYIDNRVLSACDQAEKIIIPTSTEKLDIQGCISTIQELKKYKDKIIIVINKVEDKKVYDYIKKFFLEKIGDFPIFGIQKSAIFKNIVDEKKSLNQIMSEGGLKSHSLKKGLWKQWNDVVKFLDNQPAEDTSYTKSKMH